MKLFEIGRTLIETLAVLAFIGILTVSSLGLYAKAMNSIRANYIMEQVYILANQLVKTPVSSRHKTVDTAMQGENDTSLSYGFAVEKKDFSPDEKIVTIVLKGQFPKGLCKMLKKKVETQEYAGLNEIQGVDDCENNIEKVTFIVNSSFKRYKKSTSYANDTYSEAKNKYYIDDQSYKTQVLEECGEGVLQCDPLICNKEEGWFEFDDAPGRCEQCPAGYYCE